MPSYRPKLTMPGTSTTRRFRTSTATATAATLECLRLLLVLTLERLHLLRVLTL